MLRFYFLSLKSQVLFYPVMEQSWRMDFTGKAQSCPVVSRFLCVLKAGIEFGSAIFEL